MTSLEPREENVAFFRERYVADPLWPPERLRIVRSTIEHLRDHAIDPHDIVFCYGTLNELEDPATALRILAAHCRELLILEVVVDSHAGPNERRLRVFKSGDPADLRGSLSGWRNLPTRRWMRELLREHFAHVATPLTQPRFERYRLTWHRPASEDAPASCHLRRLARAAQQSTPRRGTPRHHLSFADEHLHVAALGRRLRRRDGLRSAARTVR